jgi:DNA polymerase III alpha subunit
MLFLTIEDLSGTLDAILFPDTYRNAKLLVNSSAPLFLTGLMEMDVKRGEPYLRVEKVGLVKQPRGPRIPI